MFKRRFGHRPRSKKLLTRASANKTFKHAVREKVISINVKCQQICTNPGNDCPNGGRHILLSNAELFSPTATGFADAVRITRIEGTLWVRPDYRNVGSQGVDCQEVQAFLRHPTIFRMGLLKSPVHQALGGVPVAVNPLADGPSPFALSDAADSMFLKTWDHLFQVQDEMNCGFTTNNYITCCPTSYVVPPIVAGEQIGYIVPGGTCTPCENQAAGTIAGTTLKMPGFHALRVSYRRPIVVKENQSLDLWYGWELMKACEDDTRITQPPLDWCGHVFLTVEH